MSVLKNITGLFVGVGLALAATPAFAQPLQGENARPQKGPSSYACLAAAQRAAVGTGAVTKQNEDAILTKSPAGSIAIITNNYGETFVLAIIETTKPFNFTQSWVTLVNGQPSTARISEGHIVPVEPLNPIALSRRSDRTAVGAIQRFNAFVVESPNCK